MVKKSAHKFGRYLSRRDGYIALTILLLLLTGGIIRGFYLASKINNNSAFVYGIIYEEAPKYFKYFYRVDNKRFEGNAFGKSDKNIGDTLIVQYSTDNPSIQIIYSKKNGRSIEQIKAKRIYFWEIMW
jgi:hypothetical protein